MLRRRRAKNTYIYIYILFFLNVYNDAVEGAKKYQVGEKVLALSDEYEDWYIAAVENVNDDGTYTIKWDDDDADAPDHVKKREQLAPIADVGEDAAEDPHIILYIIYNFVSDRWCNCV
jgi:hypothetical protein